MLEIRLFVAALQRFQVGQNPMDTLTVILAVFAPRQDGVINREKVYYYCAYYYNCCIILSRLYVILIQSVISLYTFF